ncbi:hypothetical protein MOC12_21170 [Bacillus spizizenii]|nr:hypothetical protein [Bacillus spizizenii]
MTTEQIVNAIIEEGYNMTDNLDEAIYILADGQLISGDFDYGMRGTDHRMIECIAEGDRYDNNFWENVHNEFQLVRLVPETQIALIIEGQELTAEQEEILNNSSYEIEVY